MSLNITEKQKKKIDKIISELNVNKDYNRSITDKILEIIKDKEDLKDCSVCGCWTRKENKRCPFCEEDL